MISRKDNVAQSLISAAQDVTDAWVNLGPVIDVRDTESLALWLVVDINSSQDFRVRVVGKLTEAAEAVYVLPIEVAAATEVKVTDHYFELDADADQNVILESKLPGGMMYAQVQIMAGTVGATAGQIDAASVIHHLSR